MSGKKDLKNLSRFIYKIIIYSWYIELSKMKLFFNSTALFFNYIVGLLSTICDGINVVGCY